MKQQLGILENKLWRLYKSHFLELLRRGMKTSDSVAKSQNRYLPKQLENSLKDLRLEIDHNLQMIFHLQFQSFSSKVQKLKLPYEFSLVVEVVACKEISFHFSDTVKILRLTARLR